jgi:Cu/Ag efflux protein CusF
MTQLEVLKQDLAALAERINSAMAVSEDSVTLTRQQLKEFANTIQSETIEKIRNEIEKVSINGEEFVEINLYDLRLEIEVDNDSLLENISGEISDGDEVTDEDVQTYLDALEK